MRPRMRVGFSGESSHPVICACSRTEAERTSRRKGKMMASFFTTILRRGMWGAGLVPGAPGGRLRPDTQFVVFEGDGERRDDRGGGADEFEEAVVAIVGDPDIAGLVNGNAFGFVRGP